MYKVFVGSNVILHISMTSATQGQQEVLVGLMYLLAKSWRTPKAPAVYQSASGSGRKGWDVTDVASNRMKQGSPGLRVRSGCQPRITARYFAGSHELREGIDVAIRVLSTVHARVGFAGGVVWDVIT